MARKKPTRKGYKKITESTFRPEVTAYGELLLNAGRDDREVARGMLYAEEFGMEVFSRGAGCIYFDEPGCGNWDCLNPEHQVLVVLNEGEAIPDGV